MTHIIESFVERVAITTQDVPQAGRAARIATARAIAVADPTFDATDGGHWDVLDATLAEIA